MLRRLSPWCCAAALAASLAGPTHATSPPSAAATPSSSWPLGAFADLAGHLQGALGQDLGALLDPRHAGVALEDLGSALARAVDRHVRHAADLDLGAVLSTSLHALDGTCLIVDVVSRHPRFRDETPPQSAPWPFPGLRPRERAVGGVGLTRVRVDTAAAAGFCVATGHAVLGRASLGALRLSMRVSLRDTLAVVEDPGLGFRRLYPLGVGALDTVRRPGVLSSITPTTRHGRLDRRASWAVMTAPAHFQGKPYLPLHAARLRKGPDGAPIVSWYPTWIAFHVWQLPRFARGFLSHGCVRMRDEDLAELASFVFGDSRGLSVDIIAERFVDARHPHWKLADRYYRLKNVGTRARPKPWIINGVWVTEYVHGQPLPDVSALVGTSFDPPALAEVDYGPPAPEAGD